MVRPGAPENIAGDLSAGASPTIQWPDGTERPPVSYTHLRAHETVLDLVCRLLLEKKNLTSSD